MRATEPALLARARQLAEELALSLSEDPAADGELELRVGPGGLALALGGRQAPGPVASAPEAGSLARRVQGGRGPDPLLRAVAWSETAPPCVLDATAGLGADAFLLAARGCRVRAVERSAVVGALLADGLDRARRLGLPWADRVSLVQGDARQVLADRALDPVPDVVLIDPMYAPHGRSARHRKQMQVLAALLGSDQDADALLESALAVARQRVVVKRHAHAPPLAGRRPETTQPGRSTRFDVYTLGSGRVAASR